MIVQELGILGMLRSYRQSTVQSSEKTCLTMNEWIIWLKKMLLDEMWNELNLVDEEGYD